MCYTVEAQMANNIVLRDKPSLTGILVYWPTIGTLVICMLAVPFYLARSLPVMAAVFAAIILLILTLVVLRLILDLIAREFTLYTLTEKDIVTQSGILVQSQKTLPLDRIQSVFMVQTIISKPLNFGTLVIRTAGPGSARISRVPNPQRWHSEILARIPR